MQPGYQKATVQAYLAEATKHAAKQAPVFNSSFRLFLLLCLSLSTPHVNVQFDTAPSTHSLSQAMFLVHFDACRAVPDVSAMSDAYVIVQHGANTFIGGTSAACPVVAGLISLLNSERMAAGALVWTLLHVQNSSLKCWRE